MAGLEVVAQRLDRGFTSGNTASCAALAELGYRTLNSAKVFPHSCAQSSRIPL
jgi:hypothetical protein